MKNLPDKIYMKPLLMEDGESVVRRCALTSDSAYTIEYIRTDAFIEKVINFLNYKLGDVVNVSVPGTLIPELTTRRDFIEHFKKYMEDKL